ncbi:fibrobacter succinogenes major paralogous domain-containing protein [candidate division KSB1 bacterium]|nr:fibrobacter succinogenes major paralogous domain-containing protein [candidate division KSB1 bacterium]
MKKRTSIYKTVFITFVILSLLYCSKSYRQQEEETKKIETGTLTDIDGNVYKTVKIGNQWWMAENLKVTHYRNGDAIPNVTGNPEWNNLTTGAYCYYDNDSNNAAICGALYNWYAVQDSRNIAPESWHVPSDDDWGTLVDYLGVISVASCKKKETKTTHLNSPNTGAINESGFIMQPGGYRVGGYRFCKGCFLDMCDIAIIWFSTESSLHFVSYSLKSDFYIYGYRNLEKQFGHSIRLVRD